MTEGTESPLPTRHAGHEQHPSSSARLGRANLRAVDCDVITFQSLACSLCQGSGLPASCSCELFQRWGSWVVVGSYAERGDGQREGSVGGWADVVVDKDSMVGNPFERAPRQRLCEAYNELLRHILTSDIEFDRLASGYQRCVDEHRASMDSPVSRRLLQEIASKHDVRLHGCAERFCADHVRAWVGFHAQLLRTGRCIRLLCHGAIGRCPPWTSHAQGLAGALTWAATVLVRGASEVSPAPARTCTHSCTRPSCCRVYIRACCLGHTRQALVGASLPHRCSGRLRCRPPVSHPFMGPSEGGLGPCTVIHSPRSIRARLTQ